eukprot:3238642-Ditylum_brightwellii.AAC.1
MMKCANFKPLKYSMEELVEYLKEVEYLKTKNPPKRNKPSNIFSGPKKTKKGKRKCNKGKSPKTDTSTSYKKSRKLCKLCKMLGNNAESNTTDHCNKKNLLFSLLDGQKMKHMGRAKKEEFHVMTKAFKKAS